MNIIYRLRHWAKAHVFFARLYLICFHIFLSIGLGFIGAIYHTDYQFISVFNCLGILAAMTLLLLFVSIKKQLKQNLILHMAMLALRANLWFCIGVVTTNTFMKPFQIKPYSGAISNTVSQNHTIKSILLDEVLIHKNKEKRQWFNKIAKLKKSLTLPDYNADWSILLLYLLAIVAFFGILALSFGLACSISCNGNEALGMAVFIIGILVTIGTEFAIIRKITKLFKVVKNNKSVETK